MTGKIFSIFLILINMITQVSSKLQVIEVHSKEDIPLRLKKMKNLELSSIWLIASKKWCPFSSEIFINLKKVLKKKSKKKNTLIINIDW
jgi:hypothetical protein